MTPIQFLTCLFYFNIQPKQTKADEHNNDSDEDHSDHDPSEKAPLMGSTTSLSLASKKPEVVSNVPKVKFEENAMSETSLNIKGVEQNDNVIGLQPAKRRSKYFDYFLFYYCLSTTDNDPIITQCSKLCL